MPLFSDLSNISQYYSGGSSSLNYLAGPYAGHSSIVAANYRTPPSSYIKPSSRVFNRGYKPHLATISENLPSRSGLSRINSPKLLYHNSPKYTKPISINTADIDVSSNRYRHNVDRINVSTSTSPRSSNLSSSPKTSSTFRETNTEDSPKLEDDSNEVFMPRIDKNFRSTIKRERTVVRFHTNRNYDPITPGETPSSPKKLETGKVFSEPVKLHKPSWREAFEPEELSSPKKKVVPQKPLSERLIEKFLIKEKEELEDPLWRVREEERRRQREENLMNFDGECKIQRRASRRKSIKKSFHDICRTISSETIDEDLNPGQPIMRRNTRKKSDYDIMKAIRRDSAEINLEEILLLDELIKQERLDEKRPEPPIEVVPVEELLEDEVEINEDEIKRRKKFTKKKSNEKLIEDDLEEQEEQPKTTPLRRKIVKKKTSGSLDKAIEAITPKESNQPVENEPKSEPLKLEEDKTNTTPQKRKIIKKKTSTNLDSTIEAITPKEPPMEVPQSPKLVPKISGTVEIDSKPNLKLVIDDIKVEETVTTASSPTAKKFKYNVIIEEIKSPGIEIDGKNDFNKKDEPKILESNKKNEVPKVDLVSKPKEPPTNDIKNKAELNNDILVKKSTDLPKKLENKTQKSGIKTEDIKPQVLEQKSIELPKEKVAIKLEPILKTPLEPNKLDKPLVENKNPIELTKELEKHLPNKQTSKSQIIKEQKSLQKQEILDSKKILTKLGQKQPKIEPVGRRKQVQKQENLDELDIDNFWEKMGKRETIYYKDRRKYLNECRERERQKISWVPEEIEEETPKDSIVSVPKQVEPLSPQKKEVSTPKQLTLEPTSPKLKTPDTPKSKVSEPSTPKLKQTISDTSKSKKAVVPPLKQQTSEPTSPTQKQTIVDSSKPILKQQGSELLSSTLKQAVVDTPKSKESIVQSLKQEGTEPLSPKLKQAVVDAPKSNKVPVAPTLKQKGSEPLSPTLKQAVVDTPKSKEPLVLPLKPEGTEPLSPKLKQAVVDAPKSNKVPIVPTLKEQGSEPLSPKLKQAVLETPKAKEADSIQKKNELGSPKVKSVEKQPEPVSPKEKQAVVDALKQKEVDSTQKKNELGPSKAKQVDKVPEPVSPKQKQAVIDVPKLKEVDSTQKKNELGPSKVKQVDKVAEPVSPKLKQPGEVSKQKVLAPKLEPQSPKLKQTPKQPLDETPSKLKLDDVPKSKAKPKAAPKQKEVVKSKIEDKLKKLSFKYSDLELESMRGEIVEIKVETQQPKIDFILEEKYDPVLKPNEDITIPTAEEYAKLNPRKEPPAEENKPFVPLQSNVLVVPKKPKPQWFDECPVVIMATPRDLRKRVLPHRKPKPQPKVTYVSDSSDDSSDEDSSESDSSGGSDEYDTNVVFNQGGNVGGNKWKSTSSNDSGFDSSAPGSPANNRNKIEGSSNTSSGSSDSPSLTPAHNPAFVLEPMEASSAYSAYQRSGRVTPPATSIPRFRKYAVEDFCFLKVLGKGSFGKVMLAELRNTEYYYAVKCLKKDIVLEDDDVECTLIERKVLALGTKHPYLCHLFCTFQTESHLFFVMEYLNGGDLMFHIQVSGRFPEPRAKFYGAEIVSGLKFLHSKGIVYRDLKLDNILLDFDGHVRIADFGMCKLQIFLDRTADTFCGTPDYMAPEIIKGQHYNQGVDWWSFGVLLYEMLIGQSPFSGCDEDELFWSICNERPVIPVFLSREANQILTLLLEKDSAKRLGNKYCPAGDIVDIPFFKQIDWGMLERRQLEAPFKPKVQHPLDTQYFDKAFTAERVKLTPIEKDILHSMDQTQFHGFSYTNPNATDK